MSDLSRVRVRVARVLREHLVTGEPIPAHRPAESEVLALAGLCAAVAVEEHGGAWHRDSYKAGREAGVARERHRAELLVVAAAELGVQLEAVHRVLKAIARATLNEDPHEALGEVKRIVSEALSAQSVPPTERSPESGERQ